MSMRPLTWDSLTSGSRIIVPAYPALTLGVGLLFIFQNPARTQGPAFDAARHLMGIPAWGVLFTVFGIIEVSGLLTRRREAFIIGLILGAGLTCFWASLIELTAITTIAVSYTAGLWTYFVVLAHVATAASLARDRVHR